MHQTLTCVVINCMTNKDMTNGRILCIYKHYKLEMYESIISEVIPNTIIL